MSKRVASFNCYGLGSSKEYDAELVKQYDLVALQETWLFPWDLAVPSTLGIDVNSFSLLSIDVTNADQGRRNNTWRNMESLYRNNIHMA